MFKCINQPICMFRYPESDFEVGNKVGCVINAGNICDLAEITALYGYLSIIHHHEIVGVSKRTGICF